MTSSDSPVTGIWNRPEKGGSLTGKSLISLIRRKSRWTKRLIRAAGAETAELSNDTIYVNGQKVEAEVYKIGGMNYFKLRDLGKALNFYVGWSQEQGIFIDTSKPYSE